MNSWVKQRGFTIVELLIVIVVIAILAAITIVAYNGIQNRAKQSSAQSRLAQANKKILAYAVTNSDSYPASLAAAEVDNSDNGLQYSVNNDVSPRTYGLTSTNGNFSYYVSSTSNTPVAGAYAGHGVNGIPAITNLVPNPKVATGTSAWSTRYSTNGTGTGGRISGLSSMGGTSITTAYRLTLTAAPSSWWRVTYNPIDITAGETYTLSAFIRPSVAVTSGVIMIWRNGSTTISESPGTFSAHTASNWTRRSSTATAPAGATSVQIDIGSTTSAAVGTTMDVTGIFLEKSSQLSTYADGDSDGWAWSTTANSSTSSGPPL